MEGETVSLRVSVSGNPKPTIKWYFDDKTLQPDYALEIMADGSIFIPFGQMKHSGLYRMVAANNIGTAQRSFHLDVKLRELRRIFTADNNITKPIPLSEFGEYVANNHRQEDKEFRNEFMVFCC